jgi:hypothetical protein
MLRKALARLIIRASRWEERDPSRAENRAPTARRGNDPTELAGQIAVPGRRIDSRAHPLHSAGLVA